MSTETWRFTSLSSSLRRPGRQEGCGYKGMRSGERTKERKTQTGRCKKSECECVRRCACAGGFFSAISNLRVRTRCQRSATTFVIPCFSSSLDLMSLVLLDPKRSRKGTMRRSRKKKTRLSFLPFCSISLARFVRETRRRDCKSRVEPMIGLAQPLVLLSCCRLLSRGSTTINRDR